jgi:tetratricopeptide (TPR) repeat protein
MKSSGKVLLVFLLLCAYLFSQENPHALLQKAIVLDTQGQFDAAINLGRLIITSGQLNGVELGRAYLALGFAYREEGRFTEAQAAFEQSLRVLKAEPQAASDYASALENYASLYNEVGQLDVARVMWEKALHLRQQIGDHAAIMDSLVNLTGLALTEKRWREAKRYWRNASDELRLAHDLVPGHIIVFYETEGWLELSNGHASAAVVSYRHALELCKQANGEQHWLTGWDQMLLGKAYAQTGDIRQALEETRDGLSILARSLGHESPKYFGAQIVYAEMLDRSGAHTEAARLRAIAAQASKDFYANQHVRNTVSAAAFR